MKKSIFLIATLAAMSCHQQSKTPAIDLTSLDPAIAPSEDFYQYATGGWQVKNPLKPEYARFGSFDMLRDNNEARINELFSQMAHAKAEPGSINQKISDLYKMGLDSARLNAEGAAPIREAMDKILNMRDKQELTPVIAEMQMTVGSPFFGFGPEADLMDSKVNVLYVSQAGIGMGDRDYYLDEENEQLRTAYREYLSKLFALSGVAEAEIPDAVDAVMRIETEMARNMRSNVELRDMVRMYNPATTDEFVAAYDAIDWKDAFRTAGIEIDRLIVCQPEYMEAVNRLIKETPLADLRYYLAAQYASAAAPYLSDDFYAASFDFFGRAMSGKQEMRPRWKRAMAVPNDALGEAVGEMYVERYFSPEDKDRMVTLVRNLQTALGQHIDELDWMSDETKARAHEKLATFHVKIGYPDKWKDYSSLQIDPALSYWENVVRANRWSTEDAMSKVGKPVDQDEWLMTPQTVNAYYNPTTNEICFPAAILQPPFYNPDADDAVNYGAIGVVIGHEMTHGFDDQGRQFDKDGNMNNWWTEADAAAFKAKTDVLVEQFNAIEVLPGMNANGALCLGENIADQGGLRVAYTAWQNTLGGQMPEPIDGLTAPQRFYLAYAALWAQNIRDAEIARLTKLDVHSLGKWRVNATLKNIQTFYDAFDIAEGPMFLPENERVVIW